MTRSMIAFAIALAATTAAFADTAKTTATSTAAQTVQKPATTSAVTAKHVNGQKLVAPRPMPAGLHPGIPVRPDHPGVHINSVRIQGACGQPTTFVVEIQNNLSVVANLGNIVIKEMSFTPPRSLQAPFRSLNPGEKRTITVSSTYPIWCQTGELAGMVCYDVFITMEPDGVAAGQVWDGVYHTACAGTPATGPVPASLPVVTDSQHK